MRQRLAKVTPEMPPVPPETPPAEELRAMISEAAYYRAEKRGFIPGMEAEDWLQAEAEILARMSAGQQRI